MGGGRNLSSHQTCGPTSPEGRRGTEGREGWPTLAQVSPIENLRENKPGLCFNSIHSELLKLCNLQKKNQIMSRPLIIEGNLGNNFRKRQILQLCYHLEIAEVVLSLE